MRTSLCVLIIIAMLGCVHIVPQKRVTSPDGVVTQTADIDATIALVQVAYNGAQQALTLFQQGYEIWLMFNPEATPEEIAAKQVERDANLARQQATIDRMAESLESLYAARAAQK